LYSGAGHDENTIRCMRIACCITKATHTHSKYVILIVFPQQKWLRERASILNYKYIAYLVLYVFVLTLVHKEVTEF
jgi:hypothetical protein